VSVLCLVPSPLRAARAARRLCDAEGGLLFGTRVETPEGIAGAILARVADPRPILDPLAERLLVHEACHAAGGPFAGADPAGGVTRAAARLVAELREEEIPAAALADAAGAAREAGGASDRLAAAARLLGAYEARLCALGALDRAAALAAAAGALDRAGLALDLLVLDGFSAAPRALSTLLAALLARAGRTHARLPHFPERPDVDAAEPLLRAIEAHGGGEVSVALERLDGDRSPAIAGALLATAAAGSAAGACGAVRAIAAPGPAVEAAEIAAAVAGWIRGGIAPDEVAVVSADPSGDAPRLRRALAAHGIPLAVPRGEELREVPVVRVAREALAAAPRAGRSAVEALLGSSYLCCTHLGRSPSRLADLLERSGAVDGRGDPERALRARAARLASAPRERDALLRAAEAVAELNRALAPLAAAGTAREHASRLRGVVGTLGLLRRAARGDPELAGRDLAALAALDDVAEALAAALGSVGRAAERLPLDGWRALLELALAGRAVPQTSLDAGAVALWPLAEAPGLAARAVAVVGCARGKFPAPARPDPLLGDAERAAVNRVLGRGALALSGRRRATALHAAFCALAAGRERVALSWAAAGPEGAGDAPAPLALELIAAAGAPVQAGPAHLLEALPAPAAPVRLPAPLLPALQAGLPAEWTPSQLEGYARCPFRSFLELGCRLRERDDPDLDIAPRDEGSLAHAVLERFLVDRPRGEPLRASDAERARLRAAADEVFARFEREGRVGDPALWPARRALVLSRLERVLEAEAACADELAPVLVEHRFGGDGADAPALELGDGQDRVRLRGRIDRVDASPGALRVLDWKNARAAAETSAKAREEAFGVDAFQLPTYLLAAARALPGRDRLEAGYVFLRAATRSPLYVASAGAPLLATDAPARAAARDAGIVPFADAVVGTVRRIRAGEFPIAPRSCEGCGFGAVCRSEGKVDAEGEG
jgi:RecB family exonuclease